MCESKNYNQEEFDKLKGSICAYLNAIRRDYLMTRDEMVAEIGGYKEELDKIFQGLPDDKISMDILFRLYVMSDTICENPAVSFFNKDCAENIKRLCKVQLLNRE